MARVLYYASQSVADFRVLLSIALEPNRNYGNTWEGLQVDVQKSLMLRRPWKHSSGFKDELYVHFPYDTLQQLRVADPDIVFSYELGFRSLASRMYCTTWKETGLMRLCQ